MLKQIFSSWERLNFALRERLQATLAAVMHLLGRDRFRAADFAITELPLEIPGLEAAFDGYRIVQITDIHMGHWISPERLAGVIDLINQKKPDLVVITGDFVSYVLQGIVDKMITSFRRLRPKDTTLAVLGNHDHWMGAENLREILAQSEVIELPNTVYMLARGDARLYIAGLDDITVGAHDLDALLAQLPEDGPVILLAHEPDYADISAQTGRFALQLSGHSHGGQIVFPKVGALFRGPGFFKYPNGLYQVGKMQLYTSRGIGTHVFRLRYNCPPEIVVITLRPLSTESYSSTC